jgi:hypothetical protein
LGDLADLADERESPAVGEAARALDKKLVENRFNLVVLGEFKRGKTTFVNALLGAEMLPAAVVPLTSIVTAVTHGEPARARIEYLRGLRPGNRGPLDGSSRVHPEARLPVPGRGPHHR